MSTFGPQSEDPLAAPFWSAARQDRLVLPYDRATGRCCWYPHEHADIEWREVTGGARLCAWSVVRGPINPAMLYLPDYPIGHLIAFQIEQQVEKAGNLGTEFERMSRAGNLAPDIWMNKATGSPVGAQALLKATEKALAQVK